MLQKLLGELIFSRATNDVKMLYFTPLTGQVLKKVTPPNRGHHWIGV